MERRHIAVPSTEPAYTKGLSRYAHLVHLQYTKKYLDGATDVHALTAAQVQIWQWGEEAGRLNKTFARYFENHARENPAGPLMSLELLPDGGEKLQAASVTALSMFSDTSAL